MSPSCVDALVLSLVVTVLKLGSVSRRALSIYLSIRFTSNLESELELWLGLWLRLINLLCQEIMESLENKVLKYTSNSYCKS